MYFPSRRLYCKLHLNSRRKWHISHVLHHQTTGVRGYLTAPFRDTLLSWPWMSPLTQMKWKPRKKPPDRTYCFCPWHAEAGRLDSLSSLRGKNSTKLSDSSPGTWQHLSRPALSGQPSIFRSLASINHQLSNIFHFLTHHLVQLQPHTDVPCLRSLPWLRVTVMNPVDRPCQCCL